MNIGTIEIPIVSEIQEGSSAEYEEFQTYDIESTPVKHSSQPLELTIDGFLNEHLHSNSLTLDEQRNKIRELTDKSVTECSIDYDRYYGHLLIQSVSVDENGDSAIVNAVTVVGEYYPYPKHYSDSEP